MPKDIVALTSQCLAATNDTLYCFSLLPAESAGRIPFKQASVGLVKAGNYDISPILKSFTPKLLRTYKLHTFYSLPHIMRINQTKKHEMGKTRSMHA
jgi:hypothetical protein